MHTIHQLDPSWAIFKLQKSWPELNPFSSCYWVPPFLFPNSVEWHYYCLDLFNSCLEALTPALTTSFLWVPFPGGNKWPGFNYVYVNFSLLPLLPVFLVVVVVVWCAQRSQLSSRRRFCHLHLSQCSFYKYLRTVRFPVTTAHTLQMCLKSSFFSPIPIHHGLLLCPFGIYFEIVRLDGKVKSERTRGLAM